MTPNHDEPGSSPSVPPDLPEDVATYLSRANESELRRVISYAESLLPPPPTVAELLEERSDEEILEVEERDGYTKVVKAQSCARGCADCPHGPYLYHVRAEKRPDDGEGPSLHWEFIGRVE